MPEATREHFSVSPRQEMTPFTKNHAKSKNVLEVLKSFGIGLDADDVRRVAHHHGFAMDANFIQGLTTTAAIAVPVQFLQNWLTGFVNITFAKRAIDEFIGISTQGEWNDEEIVQGIVETTGEAVPYQDYTNTPFANFNVNFQKRTVVNFETGIRVGRKEEKNLSRIRLSSSETKRNGCTNALEIQRNAVGFNGYNAGNNMTYGFLNDPALNPYHSAAFAWSGATYLQIVGTLLTAFSGLETQSNGVIDPLKVKTTLALPTNSVNLLNTSTDFGYSVKKWLTESYPFCRVVSAPELNNANGGANVFYLYAEEVDDQSTDDKRTWIQVVPTKFQLLGVAQGSKFYEESYLNASAGALCKRPFAVYRVTGI